MTAIVYLDIDDEITSAAARLRSLKEARIALVLPHGSRLATSRINFRLLAREAATRHKALEIVTADASARALAASAGLPTHVSVAAVEAGPTAATSAPSPGADTGSPIEAPDDSPTIAVPAGSAIAKPRPATPVPQVGKRPSSPVKGRRLAIILGLVAVFAAGGVAGFQLLPSATITLVPTVDTVGPISINVTAQPGITQPDPAGLVVPATSFSFDVEAVNTFPATGIAVSETAAAGEVTFSSLNTGASNSIAAGSIVKTQSGIEFRTTAEVTLPPAQIGIVGKDFVVIPSTRKVGVQAVATGVVGNVPAGSIVVVPEGENPKRTLVNNDAETSGGTHTESPVVQQADIETALRALEDTLAAQFAEAIPGATNVPPGTKLFPETRALGASTPTVDPTTLVGLGQATFELGVAATGTVLGVDPGHVSTLAGAKLRSSVDAGFRLDEGSISEVIGTPIVAGTTITFPVTVRATETREVDAAALRARIRGLGLPQARTVLGAFGAVTITVWPDWVTTIPWSDSRVTLTIGAPSASPPASSGPPASSAPGAIP
ncbi:MAG: baseplate J/gp47 family protein [Chloroflexota bacterium]